MSDLTITFDDGFMAYLKDRRLRDEQRSQITLHWIWEDAIDAINNDAHIRIARALSRIDKRIDEIGVFIPENEDNLHRQLVGLEGKRVRVAPRRVNGASTFRVVRMRITGVWKHVATPSNKASRPTVIDPTEVFDTVVVADTRTSHHRQHLYE